MYPAPTCKDTQDTRLLTLVVPLLVKVFQDVRNFAHNVRTARRTSTARPALGLISFTAEAIELAAQNLRLLGPQRPCPR